MSDEFASNYADLRAAIYALPVELAHITHDLFQALEERGIISKSTECTMIGAAVGPILVAIAKLETEIRKLQRDPEGKLSS